MFNDETEHDYFDDEDITEEEEENILITELAKELERGTITDDNPSCTNGLTSLEQFIHHYFLVDTTEDIKYYRRKILAKISDLDGGWDNYNQ